VLHAVSNGAAFDTGLNVELFEGVRYFSGNESTTNTTTTTTTTTTTSTTNTIKKLLNLT